MQRVLPLCNKVFIKKMNISYYSNLYRSGNPDDA